MLLSVLDRIQPYSPSRNTPAPLHSTLCSKHDRPAGTGVQCGEAHRAQMRGARSTRSTRDHTLTHLPTKVEPHTLTFSLSRGRVWLLELPTLRPHMQRLGGGGVSPFDLQGCARPRRPSLFMERRSVLGCWLPRILRDTPSEVPPSANSAAARSLPLAFKSRRRPRRELSV